MRNLEYKAQSYRLNDITVERLKKLKIKSGLSFNIIFEHLLNLEKQYGMPKMSLGNRDNLSQTE